MKMLSKVSLKVWGVALVVAIGGMVLLLPAAQSTSPATIWAGDYKEMRWSAVASQSEGDVCLDLELTGRVSAQSGGCDFGLSTGDSVGYFADSNCEVGATLVVGAVHPSVSSVEATAIVDKRRTTETFDYSRIIPAPPGFDTNFFVGIHRKYGYVDNVTAFDANGSIIQERPSGLNVDHEWTDADFC